MESSSLKDQLQRQVLQFLRNNLRFTEYCQVDLEATIRCDKSSETLHIHEILRPDDNEEDAFHAESLHPHNTTSPCNRSTSSSPAALCGIKTNKRKARAPIKWPVSSMELSKADLSTDLPAKMSLCSIKTPLESSWLLLNSQVASPQSAPLSAELPLDLSIRVKLEDTKHLGQIPPTKLPQTPAPHDFPLSHLLQMPMRMPSQFTMMGFPFLNHMYPTQSAPKLAMKSELHNGINRRNSTGCKSFSCNQCKEKFSSLTLLSKHTIEYHKGYKCIYCQASFTQRSNLQRHSLKHVGFKPFSCRVCAKAYYRKDHLVRHIEVTHPGFEAKSHIEQRLSSSESLDFLERHGPIINNQTSTPVTTSTTDNSFFLPELKHERYDVKPTLQQLSNSDAFVAGMMMPIQSQAAITNNHQHQGQMNHFQSSDFNTTLSEVDNSVNNNNIFLPETMKQ